MLALSAQQQSIMRWLLHLTRQAEQHQPGLLERGFFWALKIDDKAAENRIRASMSRALARLERRGLVIRVKGRKKARTSRVKLTIEGRKVAEAMAGY